MTKRVTAKYLLFPVCDDTSTVNGRRTGVYDWSKFCWDGSEREKANGEREIKAPLPYVDDYLIHTHCQYLHVPYKFTEQGTIYRVRPHDSLWAGRKYQGRPIVQQRAVKREDGWYWEIELGVSRGP